MMGRLLGALLLAGMVQAQEPTPAPAAPSAATDTALERRTREVAASLRCPVCQGLSIADSPSELAQEMKGLVREQLAAGRTPDEVQAYFIGRYGEWVLLEPKPEGMNLLVYLLPVALLAGGGWFVYRYARAHSVTDNVTQL